MRVLARMAWRNLWRNPRRSGLTLTAIAFGVSLLVFSVGLQLGTYALMIENSARFSSGLLQVQRAGYQDRPRLRTDIPRASALRARLEAASAPLAPTAVWALRAQAYVLLSGPRRSRGALLMGVEPGREARVSSIPCTVRAGRYLRPGTEEVVLGVVLARNLGVAPGDEVTLLGTARDGSVAAAVLAVAGVFESGAPELDRRLAQLPLAVFQRLFAMPDRVHALVLGAVELDRLPDLAAAVAAQLPPTPPLVVLDWAHLMPGVKEAIEMDFASGWLMYLVLVLVITFGILNTFLMAVLERRRELGVLLALGMGRGRVTALVLLETVYLILLGVALGWVVGAALVFWYAEHGLYFEGLETYARQFNLPPYLRTAPSPLALLAGPAVVFASAFLAALYPAAKARRMDPARVIREGG